MYFIWRAKNSLSWTNHAVNCEVLYKQIKETIVGRVRSIMPSKISRKDHAWFYQIAM